MTRPKPLNAMPNPPTRRRRGRPSADGQDLRQQLLDAALTCFTRAGIHGSSLRAIADQAHVTPALLHYYFGDKDQLVDAVVNERLLPIVVTLRQHISEQPQPLGSLVRQVVTGVHAVVRAYPWVPALWVREVLSEGGSLRNILPARIGPQLPRWLAEHFRAAQTRGELNPALDPSLLVVSLIGLTLFPLAAEPLWQQLFPDAGLDTDRLLQHTLALIGPALDVRHA